ncbi:hypothetical protein [Pseudovibrio sp. Tun.PSC04-5.I4]|uniref:hypothetical protein n=1 Tax=Pseudovibrio sp. Tun.PSC04-5.I4 TaxID=1798213 RepID=UPI000880381D|nr:hypothetical protein [Pseudovibrio sp. Tun.PSC04-5.I4]SDQ36134.1 hypothetical protein SAMN04515695_0965 [Pseudovibrio sp. Tun.PSC04-5.I4]
MRLEETVSPVAKLLFEGEGIILSQGHTVTVEAPMGALVICFMEQRGRISTSASLRHDLGDSHYWRNLKAYAALGAQPDLRRTFAPGRFVSQPQQVLNEINCHITEPALPLAFKALAAIADHHNKKRKIAAAVERAAPTEAQVNIHGRYSMRKAIRCFAPEARGSFEVRADSEYCDVEIQHLSLEKMERLLGFLNEA